MYDHSRIMPKQWSMLTMMNVAILALPPPTSHHTITVHWAILFLYDVSMFIPSHDSGNIPSSEYYLHRGFVAAYAA